MFRMWFLFGFISLIGFVVYSLHRRVTAKWVGTRSAVHRTAYEFEVLKQDVPFRKKPKRAIELPY